MLRAIAFAVTLVVFIVLLAYATAIGALGPLPPPHLRRLAVCVLNTTYNLALLRAGFSADAPEGVTAVVWDYRGLDTVFETVVLYGAIIGTLALYRQVLKSEERRAPSRDPGRGLSTIVKISTAVIVIAIGAVGAATGLHGQLTPGGGFQAGSILAVIPVVLLVVFSRNFLVRSGVRYAKMVLLRNAGLIGIGLTALGIAIAAAVMGVRGFILQNQPHDGSPIGYPKWVLDVPSGGSLLFFNVFEMLAVVAGFTIVFLVLSLHEEAAREEIRGEERGC